MIPGRTWLATALIIAAAAPGCAGQAAQQDVQTVSAGAEEAHTAEATPLSLLDVVPVEASGAVLLEVGHLRSSFRGPELIEILRRVGGEVWEQALGIYLATDVRRAVVYSLPRPDGGPGDLSDVVTAARDGLHGLLVELEELPEGVAGECTAEMLASSAPRPLDAPIPGVLEQSCGRLRLLRRETLPEVTVDLAERSPAGVTLATAAESEGVVLVLAIGPAMTDHAACDGHEARLAGWQAASIDLSLGLALRGRYHAAAVEDIEGLEACVADGLGGLGGVPLFQQLELGDLLADGRVARDPGRPGEVVLDVSFSFDQLESFLGLLELVGEGFVGDLFR